MPIKPIKLRVARELLLKDAAHLSAASGMWIDNHTLYVVADDALTLGVFSLENKQLGYTLALLADTLPNNAKQRKAKKPDFESLTGLPASKEYPNGALLALGSGSTPLRKRAIVWPFNPQQALIEKPLVFDLRALYQSLEHVFADLNIEGLVVQGNSLKLFQRANNLYRENAVIEYNLSDLYALIDAKQNRKIAPLRIDYYDLGEAAGVPLTFTDAYALPDGTCLFSAVAEDTDNSYADGECVGAAIGLIDNQRQLRWIKPIEPVYKIEGIHAQYEGDTLRVWLVSDADNPIVPAKLLEAVVDYSHSY